MNPILYIICYAGLIAVYGLFAFTGRVPVDGFIQIVTAALAALGAAHIAGSPSKPTEPAAAPDAPPAPKAVP